MASSVRANTLPVKIETRADVNKLLISSTDRAMMKTVNLSYPCERHTNVSWLWERLDHRRLSSKIGASDDYGGERLRILEMHSSEHRVMGPRKSLLSACTPLWKAST